MIGQVEVVVARVETGCEASRILGAINWMLRDRVKGVDNARLPQKKMGNIDGRNSTSSK